MGEKLDQALLYIERLYGKGSAFMYGDGIDVGEIEYIPTGSISINEALGIGGIPLGRITEIYGPESGGKTTLVLHIISEAQKKGYVCAFIDAEHALDPIYASNIGVRMPDIILSQPNNGEEALEIAEKLIDSGEVKVVAIDSVAALVPKAEIEGEMGDSQIGLQARLMSKALRKLTALANKKKCSLIFINQIREKIGVMFGSPETTTGGRALKFYSSIRIDVRRISSVKDGNEIIANRTKVKIAKNKLAAPFKVAEFDIRFGEGIDLVGEMIDLALKYEIIQKKGAWYYFGNKKIGQGKEKARENLKNYEDLFFIIKRELTGE